MPFYKILSSLIVSLAMAIAPVLALEKDSVPNGIYLVAKRVTADIFKSAGDLVVLKNNPKFLKSKDGTIYFVLLKKPFVPFILDSKPGKGIDEKGRPKLLLSLEPNQVKPLEKLTGENIGKDIAIVLDGKVVSAHQIKETIKDGRFQITRCHDNGCETLYVELHKKKKL